MQEFFLEYGGGEIAVAGHKVNDFFGGQGGKSFFLSKVQDIVTILKSVPNYKICH